MIKRLSVFLANKKYGMGYIHSYIYDAVLNFPLTNVVDLFVDWVERFGNRMHNP